MDFFQFPTIVEGVGVAEDAPTDTMHIPSGAKNVEDAKKFLAFMSNKKAATNWATMGGMLSPNKYADKPTNRFSVMGAEMLAAADICSSGIEILIQIWQARCFERFPRVYG